MPYPAIYIPVFIIYIAVIVYAAIKIKKKYRDKHKEDE